MTAGDYSEARLGRSQSFHVGLGLATTPYLVARSNEKSMAQFYNIHHEAARASGDAKAAKSTHKAMAQHARASARIGKQYKPSRTGEFTTAHKATLGAELRN